MTSTLFIRYPELATKSTREEIKAAEKELKAKYEKLRKENPNGRIIRDPFAGWVVK